MDLLSDIITYMRRIIKSPSNTQITDNLLIDYINRFWLMDVDARVQLFDLKTTYQFQTIPNQDQYNMPLYTVQNEIGDPPIGPFPVYQGFFSPTKVIGINVPLYTQRTTFFDLWPRYVQNTIGNAVGNGTAGPYKIQVPFAPGLVFQPNPPASGLLQGHIDITGIMAYFNNTGNLVDPPFVTTFSTVIPTTSVFSAVYINSTDQFGNPVVVADSGQYLIDGSGNKQPNYGLLMTPGQAPFGNSALPGGYSLNSNTINYQTGIINVTFPTVIPIGQNINTECFYYNPGVPRAMLFYNNTLTLRNPPDQQYLVELGAYLSPAAFMNTSSAIPFGYMAEYIARGAARKILADTGDWEQFDRYEPLFIEQERLVWKRSQRQFTATRTETIYSNSGLGIGASSNGLYGSGAT